MVLYSFDLRHGMNPYAGVVLDSTGNLYGTTTKGGDFLAGVVYKIDTTGNQTVLHSFTGAADGWTPYAGVILDSADNLYGTTYYGGGGSCAGGCGVVYKLDTAGHEMVLYSFTGGADGNNPRAGVVRDSAGNLYGTTPYGGAANASGVVYKVDVTGHQTVRYTFVSGPDGNEPEAGVIRDSAGNVFGTTYLGGASNAGMVYQIDTAGHETVLHAFTGGADGGYPMGT